MTKQCSETLQVLLTKESSTYMTHDYLKIDPTSDFLETTTGTDSHHCSFGTQQTCNQGVKKRRLGEKIYPASRTAEIESRNTNVNALTNDAAVIRRHWREQLCEWAYQVVDHFQISREVVAVTMNYFDRYVHSLLCPESILLQGQQTAIEKDDFSLTIMACLSLALKLYEFRHIFTPDSSSTMDTISKLGRGVCTLQQLEQKELDILHRLKWMVHPPTSQVFITSFLQEFRSSLSQLSSAELEELHDVSTYLVELAVLNYFFVSYKPSEIAIAALNQAADSMERHCQSPDLGNFLQQLNLPESAGVADCKRCLAQMSENNLRAPSYTEELDRFGMPSPVSVSANLSG